VSYCGVLRGPTVWARPARKVGIYCRAATSKLGARRLPRFLRAFALPAARRPALLGPNRARLGAFRQFLSQRLEL
jgi:hypothetical protein